MANLIHLYCGSVTSGGTDGTLISDGDNSNPLTIGPLNASNNEESAAVKVAIRCDTGYATTGNTIILPQGTTATKWALAPDSDGTAGAFGEYGTGLAISSSITSVNTIFWVKCKATSDESPVSDTSVDLTVQTVVAAV